MKKKMYSIIASCLASMMLCSCAIGGGSSSSIKKDDPVITWQNYEENIDAYVNDYFQYVVPEAYDQYGDEYDVVSKVLDVDGNKLDSIGNMFLVKEPGEYTIQFTAFDGKTTHTKETKVSALTKTKYTLSDTNFIYGLNEEINLSGKVIPSQEGDVTYSVTKDKTSVAMTGTKFTPTELGTYMVTAKQERQPNYEFSVEVVDKAKYPLPSGMIEDSTATEQTISLEPRFTSTDGKTDSATFTLSHDETEKFDENSNGSTKIEVKYPSTSNPFDLSIKLAPRFGKTYYQALKDGGYEYVAVRMKAVDGTGETDDTNVIENYGLLFFSPSNGKSCTFKEVAQNGRVLDTPTAGAVWSGKGYEMSKSGWFELLIPIEEFIGEYADNMQFFKLRVYAGYYGELTLYIDNIYAVKTFAGEDIYEAKDLNETVAIDTLIGDMVDVDQVFTKATLEGNPATFTGNELVLDQEASYSFEFRARNRWGVRKADFTTYKTVTPLKQTFTTEADLAKVRSTDAMLANTTTKSATIVKGLNATYGLEFYQQEDKATGHYYFDVYVASRPAGYYQFLKANGYNYVKVTVTNYAACFKMTDALNLYGHGNNIVGRNGLKLMENGTLVNASDSWDIWGKTAQTRDYYVNIDAFIAGCTGTEAHLLRVYTHYAGTMDGVTNNKGKVCISNIETVKVTEAQ